MRRPGSPRVLVIDPDAVGAGAAVEALKQAGIEASAVADAETGLRMLAASEPDVLMMELELSGKDGRWLLRRLRDDFMGARPRVILYTRPGALAAGVADFGADAVVLKPAHPAALVAAASSADGQAQGDRTRELIGLSVLQGEMEGSLGALAKRLALVFRVSECIIVTQVGERQWTGIARGPTDETPWDETLWARCQTAVDAGVPLLASEPNGLVSTYLGMPLAMPGGMQLGFFVLIHDGPRLFPIDSADHLRLLSQRLHTELAWRSVHERLTNDRDRLRESSMLDPMLAVWTRAALDQTLPGEISAGLRRKEPMSFAIVDLRGLRHLNERFGHVAGDKALRHFATVVRATVRTQDLVARYTGDTLAVVLPGTPLGDARRAVERIQEALAASPLVHGPQTIPLGVVAGIATLLGADDAGETALARAATALKVAKRRREPYHVVETTEIGDMASVSPASQGLEAGTTLGGMYQILHEISRGAMGVVYRAEDLGLGRPVALKTLRPDMARDRNFVERFRIEAATLAALRHENLVQVYAFGADGDDVYFVMELVEGEPLEDRIEMARHEGKLMSYDEIGRVVQQVGDALDAMHRAGILHRDVKPANILLDRVRDRAVLVDVGIAKKRGSPTDPAGTPGFTAPESFTGAVEGAQSDVYGLAATAYTLLTTEVPFRGEGVEDILKVQMHQGPKPVQLARPGLPEQVDAVLRKSLDPDPSRRHASASAFAHALAEALEDVPDDIEVTPPRPRPADVKTEVRAVPVPAANADGSTAVVEDREEKEPTTAVRDKPVVVPPPDPARPVLSLRRSAGMQAIPLPGADDDLGELRSAQAMMPSLREPEAPSATVPHTRGVLFRSSYRVLGARHGAAWVAHVSRKHPALAEALQPQSTLLSWHPTELFVEMLEAIAESGRDAKAFARELGRVATGATFSRFFGANPAALSPWHVLSAAEHFWRRYHTWGIVGVDRDGEHGARIAISDGPRRALVCESTAGILEQVVTLSGAPAGSVTHPACEAAGGAVCEFVVSWGGRG